MPSGETSYSFSVFAKQGERSVLYLVADLGGFDLLPNATFDLEDGTITASNNVEASIKDCGNGWYRCGFSAETKTTPAATSFIIRLHNSTSTSYLGDGTSGLYIWGAQLEEI
jgi:hypothetical protein